MPTEPTPLIIARMLAYWRGTAVIYAICLALLWFEVTVGNASASTGMALTSCILLGLATFGILIYRCAQLRLRPDQLALGQGVWAIACIVLAYGAAPPARGAIISLVVVVLVFCAFALSPRASYIVSAFSLLSLGITMAWLALTDPVRHPISEEIVHFALAAAVFTAVVVLTGQFNVLRERLKRQKTELQVLALRDDLTMLPNRRRMKQLMENREGGFSQGQQFCVALLDLDRFKHINDTFGHSIGDRVLKKFGAQLRQLLRMNDEVGRWGGEEFLLLLPGTGEEEGTEILERVSMQLQRVQIDEVLSFPLTFSAGLTAVQPGEDLERAVARADRALRQAKTSGRNRVRVLDPLLERAERQREELRAQLEHAIDQEQLVQHYQPQYGVDDSLLGFEALIRWQHPTCGLMLPGSFLPLAEETGLILQIGRQVFWKACMQLVEWRKSEATRHLTLSVNVTAIELHHPDFTLHVLRTLEASGAPADRLKLEITESALLDASDLTIGKMKSLRELGMAWSLDDFGTGYSSLSYLQRLPLSQLKIDRSFVSDSMHDPNAALITRTIVALGKSLGLDVIAEGVETDEQKQFLLGISCTGLQGFLFGLPAPASSFFGSQAAA